MSPVRTLVTGALAPPSASAMRLLTVSAWPPNLARTHRPSSAKLADPAVDDLSFLQAADRPHRCPPIDS